MQIGKLELAVMTGVLLVAVQAGASLCDVSYVQTTDPGSYPSGGVAAIGVIDVENGLAVSGSIDVTGDGAFSGVYGLVAASGYTVNANSQFSYDDAVNIANPGGQFLGSNGGLLFMDAAGDQMNMWFNATAINYPFATPPNVDQPAGSYSLWGWQVGSGQNNDITQTYGTANLTLSAVPEPAAIIAGILMVLPFGASTLRILRKKRAA